MRFKQSRCHFPFDNGSTGRQFHQCFTRGFFLWKCFFCHNVAREKHLHTKNARKKCWWNWPQMLQFSDWIFFSLIRQTRSQYDYNNKTWFACFQILNFEFKCMSIMKKINLKIEYFGLKATNGYNTHKLICVSIMEWGRLTRSPINK